MKRKVFICLLAMGMMVATSGHLLAAEYPKKPVKLIINFSAGGTTDVASRLMISKASEVLEQALICINKPGAGGTLGVGEVARSKKDGSFIALGLCNVF